SPAGRTAPATPPWSCPVCRRSASTDPGWAPAPGAAAAPAPSHRGGRTGTRVCMAAGASQQSTPGPGSEDLNHLEPLDPPRRVHPHRLPDPALHQRLTHRAVHRHLVVVVGDTPGRLADEFHGVHPPLLHALG